MNCNFCEKTLRKDNRIGTCRAHRSLSVSRKSYMAEYSLSNFKAIAQYKKQWATSNRSLLNVQQRERLATNINAKLAHSLRTRLNRALTGGVRRGSAIDELGCSIEFLKGYLEQQFVIGMTWKNHTRLGWHIDHIIPLHTVDLTDIEQFKKACHYTNLRPLWWKTNISRNRIESQE